MTASEMVIDGLDRFYRGDAAAEIASRFAYPALVMSPGLTLTASDSDEMCRMVDLARRALDAIGIVSAKPRLSNTLNVDDDLAVVAVETTRYDSEGRTRGCHRSNFTIERAVEGWLVRAVSIDDAEANDTDRRAIEDFFTGARH